MLENEQISRQMMSSLQPGTELYEWHRERTEYIANWFENGNMEQVGPRVEGVPAFGI